MRLALFFCLALAACGSGPAESGGGPDDLAFTFVDLGMGPNGCNGLVLCVLENGCQSQGCISNCRKNATASARSAYDAALRCGQSWCLGSVDGGSAVCVVQSGMLVDAQPQSGLCDLCLYNSTASLFGVACDPEDDPNCNPPECTTLYQQCAANTP